MSIKALRTQFSCETRAAICRRSRQGQTHANTLNFNIKRKQQQQQTWHDMTWRDVKPFVSVCTSSCPLQQMSGLYCTWGCAQTPRIYALEHEPTEQFHHTHTHAAPHIPLVSPFRDHLDGVLSSTTIKNPCVYVGKWCRSNKLALMGKRFLFFSLTNSNMSRSATKTRRQINCTSSYCASPLRY